MNINPADVNYRIAQLFDVENVLNFETKSKFGHIEDEYERQMSVWSSAFRREALEHYFKLGWSFVAYDKSNEILGFFMGQPLLFLDHQTQTLWVEHVSAINSAIATELVDIAYRLSREKHFQRVLMSDAVLDLKLERSFPFQKWDRPTQFLKTTK